MASGWPRGVVYLKLGTGRHDDEQRQARGAVGKMLEERDEGLVGPVEVFDDKHGRSGSRELLEETSPRAEGFLALRWFCGGLQADQQCEAVAQIHARVCGSGSTSVRSSFEEMVSWSSVSKIPAWALTVPSRALKLIPSP